MSEFIALSGGFDPLHVGHLRMINDASRFGSVIILLNSDAWLMQKKGFVFMPFEQRKEMLEHVRGVSVVLPALDADGSVSESLTNLRNLVKYFGNGGDRNSGNTPEDKICAKYGIEVIYGLGGCKIQSSQNLVTKAIAQGA